LALERALDLGQVRAELEEQDLLLVLVLALLEELNKKDRDFDY